jgi:hypothetical protein
MKIGRCLLSSLLLANLSILPCCASIFGKDKLPVPQWGLDAYKILLANSITSPIGQGGQKSKCVFARVGLHSSDRLDAGG